MFAFEFFWIIGALIMLTLIGGFLIVPFQEKIKYPLFAAPFSGLLIIILGISIFYNILGLSVIFSALITTIICSITTIIVLSYFGFKKPDWVMLLIVSIILAFVTYITDYATIISNDFSILFLDGTDHLAYSHLADWLASHTIKSPPVFDINHPYQIWPDLLFRTESRFGSFFLLALIANLHNHSATFSYDIALTLILCTAFLAVSSVYTRNRFTFFLLFLGLLVSNWYDLGRSGYFAKTIGFPAVFFLFGLFLNMKRPAKITHIAVLSIIACAASCVYSALAITVFIASLALVYLSLQLLTIKDKKILWIEDGLILGVLLLIALATLGIFSKPSGGVFGMMVSELSNLNEPLKNWLKLMGIPNLLSLEHHYAFMKLTHLSKTWLAILSGLFGLIVIGILSLALFYKKYSIATLLLTPMIMLICLISVKQDWTAYQFSAVYYPLFLCGGIKLLDELFNDSQKRKPRVTLFNVLLLAIAVMISMHIPRFFKVTERYASKTNHYNILSMEDFNQLQHHIDTTAVTIDVPNIVFLWPINVELGRRNINLQFTQRAWDECLGSHLKLSAPPLKTTTHLLLVMANEDINVKNCSIRYSNIHYKLLSC